MVVAGVVVAVRDTSKLDVCLILCVFLHSYLWLCCVVSSRFVSKVSCI